jgi:hypothetical protein
MSDLDNTGAEGKGIVFDPTKIKVVPIDDVIPNTWNPKDDETEELLQVINEIKSKGLRAPVYVRHREILAGVQKYEIADGEQRWTACKKLNYKVIPIYDWEDLPLKEAQEMTLGFQVQVPFNEIKLAHLLKEMVEKYSDNLQVPYTPEQIKNYLDMANFDWASYKGEALQLLADEPINMTVEGSFLPEIKNFIIQNEPKSKSSGKHIVITGLTTIKVSETQMKIIKDAIEKVMIENGTDNEGRALELIMADILAGPDIVKEEPKP